MAAVVVAARKDECGAMSSVVVRQLPRWCGGGVAVSVAVGGCRWQWWQRGSEMLRASDSSTTSDGRLLRASDGRLDPEAARYYSE